MKNILYASILLTLLTAINCLPSVASDVVQVLPSGLTEEELPSTLDAFFENHASTTAAAEVAVFQGERLLYRKNAGYADRQNAVLADELTVFEWGSATKILVWISIMQLEEQGKLSLDVPVQKYLPKDFMKKTAYDEPITIRHLMNHSAGFEDMIVGLFETDVSFIDNLGTTLQKTQPRQIYRPGTVTAYSNWGVALAGYIVEQVSGLEFYQYVYRNIFSPLNMTSTAVSADLSDNLLVQTMRSSIRGYAADGQREIPDTFYIPLYPSGMSTGTLSDFLTLAQALVPPEGNAGPLFEKRETLDRLYTPTLYYGESTLPRNCHGLWVNLYAVPVIGHGGNTAAMSSYLLIDPVSCYGVVIMTNQQQEQIYNTQLPPLLFGTIRNADYLPDSKDVHNQLGNFKNCKGFFTSSRTILSGPCLMNGLISAMPVPAITEEKITIKGMNIELIRDYIANITGSTSNFSAVYVPDSNGYEKISLPYQDMIKTSWIPFVCRYGAIFICSLMSIYAFVMLITGAVRRIARKVRITETLHYRFCASAVASYMCIILFVASLFTYQHKALLQGLLIIHNGLIILQTVYAVYMMYRVIGSHIKRGKTAAILDSVTAGANIFVTVALQLVPIF